MQFTRTRYGLLAALLGIAALMLAGCGGDDNGGLSAEDMARIAAAEDAAAMAQAAAAEAESEAMTAHEEAEAAKMEAAAAHEEAEAAQMEAAAAQAAAAELEDIEIPEPDTSETDAALAALEATVAKLAATPKTAAQILGADEDVRMMSANDRAALATAIAKQLNATYDHDNDMSLVDLREQTETVDGATPPARVPANVDALTQNIAHASADDEIMSSDGTSRDGGFLRHSFTGGPTVDLTSPGDIETLRVGNLLTVNGVDLKSFSLKETDKAMTQTGGLYTETGSTFVVPVDGSAGTGNNTNIMTTTLGADGSSSIVVTSNTGTMLYSQTITYDGGFKKVHYWPIKVTALADSAVTTAGSVSGIPITASEAATVTQPDGDMITINLDTTTSVGDPTYAGYNPANPTWVRPTTVALPAADQANAKAAYANAGAAFTIAQHNAMGYGAWLEDSFFVAYVMNAEDDAIISDPDDMVMKVAWGGRTSDPDKPSHLSGRGEKAYWKGLMVGHDMDADAATSGKMLKGNAMVTARVSDAVLADRAGTGNTAADVVDVMLSNIITADGTAVSRVAGGIEWKNLDLTGGYFEKGSEIRGGFYDNGNEVVGEFNKEDILGVFGAMEYDMPAEEMMDMASQ